MERPERERMARGALRARDSLPGQVLNDRYHVESLLAEGGMGCVYLGYDAHEDRTVAIKVLQARAAADESLRRRFLNEARTTAKIVSEHVVGISDLGELDDGSAFYVMEYLEGVTLDEHRIDTLEELKAIALQICAGLAAAHAQAVVHRDLKPENIIVSLSEEGQLRCRLIDFGIAKLPFATMVTMPGQVLGTPAYIAPEQAKAGRAVDHRSDIYALGVVLYELVTCSLPFDDEDPIRIALAHLAAIPEPVGVREPSCPPALAALIMRCLEKDPAARYPDVATLERELAAMDLRGVLGVSSTGTKSPAEAPTVDSVVLGEDPGIDCARTVLVDRKRMPISVSDLLGVTRPKHITPPEPEPWLTPLPESVATLTDGANGWPLWIAVFAATTLAVATAVATTLW